MRVSQVILAGQQRGQFLEGDPRLLALVLIGTVARTARWYDPGGPVKRKEFAQTLLTLLLGGITSGAGGAKSPK